MKAHDPKEEFAGCAGLIIFVLAVCLIAFCMNCNGQSCDNPYSIGLTGNWNDCWEGPPAFSNDCFDAFPEPLCYQECNGVWIEFESMGPVSIIVESDLHYWYLPNGPETIVHLYIMDENCEPIFYLGECGDETLGWEYYVNITPEMWGTRAGVNYVLDLLLPEGTFYLTTMGYNPDDPTPPPTYQEGCLSITIINNNPLALNYLEYVQSGGVVPYGLWVLENWTLIGQKK